uniref:Homeobox domain-containing protein n=1 Tax=Leersia perrieri TaxID=77586 RepID=A0A0D9VNW1_9ORYZ
MAHDPSLGFADYFSAADGATASSVTTLMPTMVDDTAPELYGLQSGIELLGMIPGATTKLADAANDGGAATMRFVAEHHHHHNHHNRLSQAPLSLSLSQIAGAARQHPHLAPTAGAAPWMQHDAPPTPHGVAWQLRGSRFLVPAQQVLQEFCSLPVDTTKRTKPPTQQEDGSSASAQIQAMEALELQRLKDKLYIMLEEVDRRYRRYCEQMRSVSGGFEAVAGERAAAAYTAVAARTISRHFRSLRDGVVSQLQAVRKALGEKDVRIAGMTRGETPRLKVIDQCVRHHKSLGGAGGMDGHPWRPQRGLPERAVTILRAWLFEHFLHPYPSDVDKHILARQTGLSRSQVSNWFINARVRLWKPMVEEMYVEEMKDGQDAGNGSTVSGGQGISPNTKQAAVGDGDGDGEQKPTTAQLRHHDATGSLASVVNVDVVARDNFGIMGHLDFDAYGDNQHNQHAAFVGGGGGGVSLTLGLQHHGSRGVGDGGGVNIAFGAPASAAAHGGAGFVYPGEQMVDVVQFMDGGGGGGDASHGGQEQRYRSLSAGFHLLRDLAG